MSTGFSFLMVLASIGAALAVLAFAESFKVRDITGRIGGGGWGRHIDARWHCTNFPDFLKTRAALIHGVQ